MTPSTPLLAESINGTITSPKRRANPRWVSSSSCLVVEEHHEVLEQRRADGGDVVVVDRAQVDASKLRPDRARQRTTSTAGPVNRAG